MDLRTRDDKGRNGRGVDADEKMGLCQRVGFGLLVYRVRRWSAANVWRSLVFFFSGEDVGFCERRPRLGKLVVGRGMNAGVLLFFCSYALWLSSSLARPAIFLRYMPPCMQAGSGFFFS